MSGRRADLLVSPAWLMQRLGDGQTRVVDASWYLPAQERDARAEYLAGHIPGAVFFDIDAISDRSTALPHMLPSADQFGEAAGAMGISETDTIVVYDGAGLFSAPRVWWAFRVFGAADVRVLDGGLPAWKAAGLPLERGEPTPAPARFRAVRRDEMVRDFERVGAVLRAGGEAVVDARPGPRFRGEAAEPRAGLKRGHMPGARSLPIDCLVGSSGSLVDAERITAEFAGSGIDLSRPVTATCGSGVTAAILVFALATLGKDDVALYDGSWAEWGGRDDTPIATGPE